MVGTHCRPRGAWKAVRTMVGPVRRAPLAAPASGDALCCNRARIAQRPTHREPPVPPPRRRPPAAPRSSGGGGGSGGGMQPYHLVCDRAPMSADLGPPDYWPLQPVRSGWARGSVRRGGRTLIAEAPLRMLAGCNHAARRVAALGRRGPLTAPGRPAAARGRRRAGPSLPSLAPPSPPSAPTRGLQGGCPEDSLDAASLVSGYKWTAEAFRITDANESLLSLTCHTTYWDPRNVAALRQVRGSGRGPCGQSGQLGTGGWACCRATSTTATMAELQCLVSPHALRSPSTVHPQPPGCGAPAARGRGRGGRRL
jgi:hypothetical protein